MMTALIGLAVAEIDGRSDKVLDVYAATLSELVEASWMQVVFSRERGAVALYLLGNGRDG